MKASILLLCFGALPVAPTFSFAAEPSAPQTAEPALTSVLVDPESPEVAEIRAHGERAINRVGYSLVTEVSSAIAKEGIERAVEMCHLKALPLTGEIISGMPRITAVKRTSLRVRNPANAPDAAEQLVLDRVQKDVTSGDDPPKVLVQRIDLPGGKREWRVYRPVGVLQQCAECHGPSEKQSAALRETLQTRYPNDKATGYAVGEWRGLIRVTVADPPPPTPPKAPVSPATKTKQLPSKKA